MVFNKRYFKLERLKIIEMDSNNFHKKSKLNLDHHYEVFMNAIDEIKSIRLQVKLVPVIKILYFIYF